MKKYIFTALLLLSAVVLRSQSFVHPGILHDDRDLERIRTKVAEKAQPWWDGYLRFAEDPRASFDYDMNGPWAEVMRTNPVKGAPTHKKEFEDDCLAAYYNALQWNITGDGRHAAKAIEILDGYSATLRSILNHDRQLMAGLCGFLLANAAELMRHTYDKWDAEHVARCETMFREVIYPVIENFATFANGNWDAACIKGVMAIGVFCDDRAIFERGVDYFHRGEGNGRLTYYVINDEGQCQESGRDQPHVMFGLACLAEACEVGFKQGLDMYSAADFRLMKGFEYTSKYNLGHDVPFRRWLDTTGKYRHEMISEEGRGKLRAIFELPYNHYARRAGQASAIPFLAQAAARVRPEGEPWTADNPGYGTLLFTLDSFTPGELWPDDKGVHINAHGGGILFHDGRYYWFGEHKTEGRAGNRAQVGVHVYSSTDLYNWKDEGIALSVAPEDSGSPIEKGCILERPKVIYNAKTQKFVMWFHLEPKGMGYGGAQSGVAVSDRVTGPYTFLRAERPEAGHWPLNAPVSMQTAPVPSEGKSYEGGSLPDDVNTLNIITRDLKGGQMARDMNLFVDDDGKAYHIYSSEENSTLHISLLSDDYTAHSGVYSRHFDNRFMEAPAMFKHRGRYYLMMSGCTGWRPNAARSAVADSPMGPWRELGNPCVGTGAETTFESQSTFILPVQGREGRFVYMGDRWRSDDAIDGRYVWLPLEFEGEGESERFILRPRDEWNLDSVN